ncbi:MAG: alcohol dehydrogenase catalytic domain-containing protein [Sporichthyaceae bacterium]
MRALVVSGPGRVALEERADPVPGPGDVLVRPAVVGLCGTDLEIIDGSIDPAYVRLPLVLGHEWSGVVVAAGDSTSAPPVGSRVVVEGIVPCRVCAACAAGDTNRCATYDEFGFVRDGAAAELLAAPAELVHVLDAAVSAESGALVEPAAVVLQALLRAAPRPGQRVLVVGDGTVGLLAVTLARLWSPASVTLLGARQEQAPLATAAGADLFVTSPEDAGGGYDLVVEAAGVPAAVSAALHATARGGTVLLLGLAGTGKSAPLPIDDLVNGDVTVLGSFSYTVTAWTQLVQLLNTGRLDLGFLVTHRFPLSDWAAALDALRSPTGTRGKVLLDLASA